LHAFEPWNIWNDAESTTTIESEFVRSNMAELYPYPRFSLAERDRRWKAVRKLMRQQTLDVIVTPNNTGHSMDLQSNTRYLTHCGGGGDADIAAVFPL
jgi:hypothetical protein